jgi:hypothetical protein
MIDGRSVAGWESGIFFRHSFQEFETMLRSLVLLTAGLGIVGIGSDAFARCCHRRNNCCAQSSCCAPATTCCAPAPSCCAPGGSSCSAPAAGTAPMAPVEDVAPPVPGPQASGNQTYRSYSYDPVPASAGIAPAPVYYYSAPASSYEPNIRADRKVMGRVNRFW